MKKKKYMELSGQFAPLSSICTMLCISFFNNYFQTYSWHFPHIHPLMSNLYSSDRVFVVIIFWGDWVTTSSPWEELLREQLPEPCSRKSHSWIIILVPAIIQILKMLMKGKQPWETEWGDSTIRKRGVNISIWNWACVPCFLWHNKM